jgi:hypothetical protein
MQGFFIAPAMGVLTSELLAIGPPVDNTELQKNENILEIRIHCRSQFFSETASE